MEMICYIQSFSRDFQNTWATLEKNLSPQIRFELYQTSKDLENSLRRPRMNIAVVLLYLNDKTKLSEFLPLQSILIDLPLIILLDDQDPEVLKFSHHLRPRVILYSYFGIRKICAVLERFLTRYRKPAGKRHRYYQPRPTIQQRSRESCLRY